MKNSFSRRLIEERERLGFTQEELAEKISAHRKTITRYETGQYKAPLTEMAKIGIDTTYVITGVRLPPKCLEELKKAMAQDGEWKLSRKAIVSVIKQYVRLLEKLEKEE